MDNTLDLKTREGLPEALRLLLADFPRDEWQHHANFAGLVAFWLDRHMMFRRLCDMLKTDAEAAVDRRLAPEQLNPRISRFGGMLVQQLHGHHQIEDMHYFPVLSRRETALTRGFEILDKDHHAMDGLLDRFTRSANGVLQGKTEAGVFRGEVLSFESMLLRHLEDEEDLIVPVILPLQVGHLVRVEIHMDVVAVRVAKVDLHDGEIRHRIDAVADAGLVQHGDEGGHVRGAKGKMFKRAIAARLRVAVHLDQVDIGLIAQVQPGATHPERRPGTGKQAQKGAIPIDHGLKVVCADIDVIKGDDGHGADFHGLVRSRC